MDLSCHICGGPLKPWLAMALDAKKDQITPYSNVLRCSSCSTGQVIPQPAAEDIQALYELPEYYTHGKGHMPEVRTSLWDRVLQRAAWTFDKAAPFSADRVASALPANGSILDLGCGDGKLLERFRDLGFQVIGVDPDRVARMEASKRGIEVLEGTAEDLPESIRTRSYDLVILTHSLEHCRRPMQALGNAFSVTSKGGLTYVEVPNSECVHFETINVCSEMFDNPRHLWYFSCSGLRTALENSGYSFETMLYHGFTRHHSASWRAWEREIYRRLKSRGLSAEAKCHTIPVSWLILAESAFVSPERKYDCVGILARRSIHS